MRYRLQTLLVLLALGPAVLYFWVVAGMLLDPGWWVEMDQNPDLSRRP
jgi:hypothetical protein